MHLFDIDQLIEQALQPDENGEITPEQLEQLQKLEMQREQKLENIALYIKNERAFSDALDVEIKRLQAKKRAADNRVDSLKNYLQHGLNGEKLKTARVTVSYRTSKSVQITDESALPDEVFEVKRVASKTKIKHLLPLAGAKLVENTNIIIK